MRPHRILEALSAVVVLSAAAACSESTSPNADVAATYEAIVLRLTEGTDVTDLLAEGADLSLELKEDGTTTGAVFIPGAYTESGEDETVPLNGTYTYDPEAETVTFDMVGDSFVRDITWTVDGNQLRGTYNGAGITLTAVLQVAPGISEG